MRRHLVLNSADHSPAALSGPHGTTGAPIWELVKVTAESIIEVVILSAVGYILARRGIIDKRTQTKINKINVSFFTPALLFSKVAFSLNPHRLAELVIVPLGFVIVTLTSALVAWILAKVARLSKQQRNFTLACAISPNSNSLPVALMQSLVLTVPQLHWEEEGEPEDTVDGMLGRALTYLVLYSTLGMFVRWSIGAKLLSTIEDTPSQPPVLGADRYRDDPEEIGGGDQARTARLIDFENGDRGNARLPQIVTREATDDNDRPPPEPLTDGGRPPVRRASRSRSGPPAWARSFPNSPAGSAADGSVEDEDEARTRDLESHSRQAPTATTWKRVWSAASRGLHYFVVLPAQAVAGFMTAPLWAAVLSLVVALIQPLQRFLDSIEPLVGALQTSGACSIPLTMIVLGAYFVEDKQSVTAMQKPINDNGGPAPEHTAGQDMDGSTAASTLAAPTSSTQRGSLPWMKNPWKSGDSSVNGSDIGGGGSSSYAASEVDSDDPRPSGEPFGPSGASGQAAHNAARNAQDGPGWPMSSLNKRRRSKSPAEAREAREKTMERRTIAVAITSRMIATPLLLIPPMWWYAVATRYNVMDDPVFIAAACLIIGSPPALTLAQITSQNAGGNKNLERLISRTIFVSYSVLAAPTTILLVLSALLIAENDH
ncbi:unnamed protein product [Parajaminaea phylloscopi]